MGLLKSANLLDLVHEVAPVHVFHHKIQAILKRRGREREIERERRRERERAGVQLCCEDTSHAVLGRVTPGSAH